jgi:selenium-binding protein 1
VEREQGHRNPAEPADPARLPPALKPFKAVPPLITDINLSLDDQFLYVACWGTGELRCYDVSQPLSPHLTASVQLGGIVRHTAHPKGGELNGGPQMLEVSRDGTRIYFSNSLYGAWDARGWVVKVDALPGGGLKLDSDFFMPFEGQRPHQIRLQGGDSSSDSLFSVMPPIQPDLRTASQVNSKALAAAPLAREPARLAYPVMASLIAAR